MELANIFSSDDAADRVFASVDNSISDIKAMQRRKVAENVQVVIQALKKIESDLQDRYDGVTTVIEKRVASLKDGRDGIDGRNGRDGKDGRPGRDGAPGARGPAGAPGMDGRDGQDGVSVTDARIDFDGSLIIGLSSGREINVGEVVAPDLAERIKVITNGGGTSQTVLDALAGLQAQIDAFGSVNYQGTWNAATNTPTITSSVGTNGYYYVVSVAGSTNINGISTWAVGDWIIFNGSVWQKIAQGNTGNFTDLSASGTVTLSGGTANAVAYLNGSKVLTTGSALTFDGTNLGVNCTATNFGANYRTVEARGATTTTSGVFRASSSDSSQKIDFFIDSGVGTLRTDSNHPLAFSINNAEQMRLTSTGLGIGTSSPSYKLDVSGTFRVAGTSNFIVDSFGAVQAPAGVYVNTTGTRSAGINSSGEDIRFRAGNADDRMILDAAGNLGLGVTPSAWWSGVKALQVNGASLLSSGVTASLTANAHLNSSAAWTYTATNSATHYEQTGGQHRWNTAPSGTAGNAISFTQAMTLDASGRLGIGTTTPSYKLDVSLASGANLAKFTGPEYAQIVHTDGVRTLYTQVYDNAARLFTATSTPLLFGTVDTERARIDSSGNFGVGSTSPSTYGKMVVEGSGSFTNALVSTSSTLTDKPTLEFRKTMNVTSGQTNTVGRVSFNGKWGSTQGEQAYVSVTSLNASGIVDNNTLKISTTSIFDSGNDQSWLTLQANGFILANKNGALVQIIDTTPTFTVQADNYRFKSAAGLSEYARFTTAGEFYIAGTTDQGAYNLQVNGTGVWGAGAYVNGSDARLKEDVQDLAPALDVIAALRPVTFRYKEDYSKDQNVQPGFIAQELQQAMQGQAYVDGVVQSGPEFLNVAYQSLVPLLTKAIQEQQAIINQLKADVAALKGA
jgi:hypothetical protein